MKKLIALLTAFALFPCIVSAECEYFGEELSELKALLDECDSRKINVPYEEVAYATLERFAEYIVQDEAAGVDSAQLDYNKGYMQTLYAETCDKLNSYLSGESEPLSLKKYNMSAFHDFKDNGREVYSIGYGHGTMARRDIRNLSDFGATNIQIETGPTRIFTAVPSFSISKPSGSSAEYSIANNSAQGNYLKVKNTNYGEYIYFSQYVDVEPNTEYIFGMDAIGILSSNYSKVSLTVKGKQDIPNVISELNGSWKTYQYKYTTASDETEVRFIINATNEVPMLWIDNCFIKKADGENLLLNGSFDDTYDKKEIENLKKDIELARKNNLSLSLLLSPHYFPSDMASDIYASGDNGFIDFNIDREETREYIERYLRVVCDELKDCKGITNILLSNEPVYITTNWYDFYNPVFNSWLKKKYGTISALNSAYGSSYTDFPEIQMPAKYIWHSALFNDWISFNEDVFTDWHVWMADIVGEYMPDIPLHVKTMNPIPFSTDNHGSLMHGANIEKFDVFSDWAGNDAASYGDSNGGYSRTSFIRKMFWYDYLSSTTGKPVYNSEDHVMPNYHTEYTGEFAKMIRADLWQGMIHHNRMSTIWHWSRSYDTASDACNGILHRPDCIYAVGQTSLDVTRLSDKITRIAGKQPKVGIYYSEASRNYCEDHGIALRDIYDNLLTLGQSVGVVTELNIDRIYNYDVVIFGNSANTTEEAADIIENYAENGGTVVLVGNRNLTHNEHNKAIDCNPENAVRTTFEDFREDITPILKKKGLMRVEIVDNATGQNSGNVEWQYHVDGTGFVVNIMSLEGDYNASVYLDGVKQSNLTDLLSGDKLGAAVPLSEFVPRLVSNPVGRTPGEVTVTSVHGKTVTWDCTDEAYDSAHIYTLDDNNELLLLGKVSGNSYTVEEGAQLIIKAVDFYGRESLGVPVNVNVTSPLAAKVIGREAVVTNTTEKPVSGELSVSLMYGEDIVKQRVSTTFILNPGETTSLVIPFEESGEEYVSVQVK